MLIIRAKKFCNGLISGKEKCGCLKSCVLGGKMSRFAVSDVAVEVEGSDAPSSGGPVSTLDEKPTNETGSQPPKMDYLTVAGTATSAAEDKKNIESNQATVTSMASGNLALYEVEWSSFRPSTVASPSHSPLNPSNPPLIL